MKQKAFWRMLSLCLSAVMLLQMATFVAFAQTSEQTDETETEPILLGEIIEKRTETEKYFMYSDNSVVAAVYPDAVHYEDPNGKMQSIDNCLIETTADGESYAQNTANLWNVKFAKKAKDGKLAKLKYKTHNITWYLQGAEKTEGSILPAAETLAEDEHAVYGTSSGMRYDGILPNTDLEYLLIGKEIKENIVLHKAEAVTDYTFVYDVGALHMQLRDNVLYLLDGEQTVLILSAPVMQDAVNEYSSNITLSLQALKENGGKHQYAVTVSPDKEWATAEERVFPITIDPTLTTEQDKNHIEDTYVDSSEPSTTHQNATTIKVGMNTTSKLYRTYLKFDLPTGLGAHDRVVSAYLNLHPNTTAADMATMAKKEPVIYLYEAIAAWDASTLTWNNQPWTSTAANIYAVMDYDVVRAKGSESAYRYYQWDITEIVDRWYTTGNNKGLMLKYYDESSLGSNMVVNFVSTQTNISNSAFPCVTFRYINMLGLEDYWTYQTLDNGQAGTAYINNFTGGMTLVTPLASVASERMPINVSLIYSPDSVNRNSNSLNVGTGFMLNLQASVTSITVGGTQKYKYIDADGTIHYFGSSNGNWVDEDGLGLKLTIDSTYYTITDKQDSKMRFYVNTGRLYSITDSTGNTLQLSYETDTSSGTTKYFLKSATNGKSTVSFVRNGNFLEKIVYPDEDGTTRHVLFTYIYPSNDIHHVTQYVLAEGSTTQYIPTDVVSFVANGGIVTEVGSFPYDSSNPPGQSGSVLSGTALIFTHSATGSGTLRRRVTSYKLCAYTETPGINQSNTQGTSEYEITVTYGIRFTKYTKAIPGSFTQTELYTFNQYGHTITVQDFDGNAKFQSQGIAGGEKNKVTFASGTQRSVINLLKNHNFEKNTGAALPDWPKYGNTGDNAAIRGTADASPTYRGNKAMKVFKNTATQTAHSTVKQNVTLAAGKIYTLSAYVHTDIQTLDTTNSKAGAFFGVENSDYSIQFYKNAISSEARYIRYFLTIDLTAVTTTQSYSVFFGVRNARGVAYFDCVQLEEGNVVNSYNLIENGAFSNTADTVSWVGTNLASYDQIESASGRLSSPGVRLYGRPNIAKKLSQTLALSGSAGTCFTAGVWVRSWTVPHKDTYNEGTAQTCSITLEIKNSTTGQKQFETVPLESPNSEWRYICLGAIANFAFTEVSVHLKYLYNCNTACFDEVNLFMDKFGQSFTYDANGNVTSVVDLANNTKNIVTNGNNDMTSYTDGNGNKYSFAYDNGSTTAKKHLLTKVTNPDGSTLSNVYNSFGSVTKSTVAGGGLSMTSSVEYTEDGNFVQSETDAAGVKTEYTRDDTTGRLYKIRSSTNMIEQNTTTGVEEQITDTSLLTFYEYDAKTKQLAGVSVSHTKNEGTAFPTVELSPKVSYSYYKGRMTDLLRKSGTGENVTKQMGYHFTYDDFGKTTAVHWSGKNNTEYLLQNTTYHGWMGVPGTVTYGNGQYVQYHYNRAGQMYRKLANGTAVAKYNYNANNNLGSSAYLRSDGKTFVTTHYFYDLAGRIMETASSLGFTTDKYTFDKNNNVTQYRTGLKDNTVNLAYYTKFTYNNMNSLTNMYLQPTDGYGSGTMNFKYDGLQRLIQKDVTLDGNTNLAEVYTYEKNYDGTETGRLGSVTLAGAFGGNSVNLGYANTYTENGMIASQTATKNGTSQVTNYLYDELGQLMKETRNGETYAYTYDGGGNLLSQSKTTSSGVTSSAYTYDSNLTDLLTKFTTTLPNGTTSSKTYTYNTDAAGNYSFVNPLTITKKTNDTVTDTWNLGWREGRVLQSIASSAGTVQYEYNENGLRTYKKLANGEKEEYYYNGSQLTLLKHLNASGALTYALHFIYDSNGQMQYILYNAPANAKNAKIYELYYIVRDLTGAVTKLIKTRTGTSTSITPVLQLAAEYSYDPYGKLLGVTTYNGNNIGNINPIRYKDYFYDTETGFYLTGTRYYDPEIGRFINADNQISGVGSDIRGYNLFAYCFNNPVNMSDPTGNWPRWITATVAAVATVVAVVATVVSAPVVATAAAAVAGVSTVAYVAQSHHYDKRKAKNTDLPAKKSDAINQGWKSSEDPTNPQADCHQYTSPDKTNVKFVSPDGHREVIYNSAGDMVLDSRDIGTYNFSPSGTFWGSIGHLFADMLPWYLFGNDDDDPGPLANEIIRLFE